jgi:hypothetical protein
MHKDKDERKISKLLESWNVVQDADWKETLGSLQGNICLPI